MLDVRALKAEMIKKGYTQVTLSEEIGMSPRTFSNRLKTGDFGTKEIEVITSVLDLKDPWGIFFAT
jgi:lambda repressor-like predicted transcriptional regulator